MSTDLASGGAAEQHAFSCALSAVLIARVQRAAGEEGVRRLLTESAVRRPLDHLLDVGNWIGFDEAIALWETGETITRDPNFARHVGEDAVDVLGGSAVAAMLRTLGIEEHLRRLDVSAHRFSLAADVETVDAGPGHAEIRVVAASGFVRHRLHCEWTMGMLVATPTLFGLGRARVEHTACQALGAPDCRYEVTWEHSEVRGPEDASEEVSLLRRQLDAMADRLQSVFATAADLIATGNLPETLGRIADRAAQQVRAPQYLLAVRTEHDPEVISHRGGLDEAQARAMAERLFEHDGELPAHWCAAVVASHRREYGRLVAVYPPGSEFMPEERELLELYARYAATALDSATALAEARLRRDEAQRRHEEARTLLDLARALAEAGTSEQVASRLADAVLHVVDCERVTVYLWDEESGELRRRAVTGVGDEPPGEECYRPEDVPQIAAWLEQPDPEPLFTDLESSPIRGTLRGLGAVASVTVPIASPQRFLGTVQVSVRDRPERLAATPELRDRLSGVAAHAITALENGRLVDHITHQARHDRLTGLANRLAFGERFTTAAQRARATGSALALYYVDLDGFKPVNDEYGHETGDAVLAAAARRLLRCVRENDVVARLGGDEFAVLMAGIGSEELLDSIAERFAHTLAEPFAFDGHELPIRASIGRALWPDQVADVDDLLRAADAAMYAVKRTRPGTRRAA